MDKTCGKNASNLIPKLFQHYKPSKMPVTSDKKIAGTVLVHATTTDQSSIHDDEQHCVGPIPNIFIFSKFCYGQAQHLFGNADQVFLVSLLVTSFLVPYVQY